LWAGILSCFYKVYFLWAAGKVRYDQYDRKLS